MQQYFDAQMRSRTFDSDEFTHKYLRAVQVTISMREAPIIKLT